MCRQDTRSQTQTLSDTSPLNYAVPIAWNALTPLNHVEIFSLVCTVAIALLAKRVFTRKEFALASAPTNILHMLELYIGVYKKQKM